MKYDWRFELPSWMLLAGMLLLGALSWGSAPDRIAVHWGLDLEPDRYGGKFEGLLAIPLVALGLYLLLLFLPLIDPGRANYPRFAGAYATVRIALVAFMAVIYGFTQLWMRGVELDLNALVPLIMGVLFVVLGNVMGKIRPNWFVGIRTPWTLTSKVSWLRTHRLGGWVFVLSGLAWLASALIRKPWAFWLAALALVAGIVLVTAYSYFVWRADPEKVPPAGTEPA